MIINHYPVLRHVYMIHHNNYNSIKKHGDYSNRGDYSNILMASEELFL